MIVIKQKQTNRVEASPSTTLEEYQMEKQDLSAATAIIQGRYPTDGFAINTLCQEIALVISGEGAITTPRQTKEIVLGDCIYLDKDEKFYWSGNLTLFIVCTPSFDAKQHKLVK